MKSTPSFVMIDAHGNPGDIVGKFAADEAMKLAKESILAGAVIKNMESWLRPGGIAEYITNKGFIALVTNDGGGSAVAPPGGFNATIGTNPLAYGIPTEGNNLVVDMATSKKDWGHVRQARASGTQLPEDTFYNSKGEVTLNPDDANSVKAFGEYKGFALGFLIEVLSGALTDMEMLRDSENPKYAGIEYLPVGAFILVIDPNQISTLDTFKREVAGALAQIKSSQTLENQEIRIPGELAGEIQARCLEDGSIEVEDEIWEEIQGL